MGDRLRSMSEVERRLTAQIQIEVTDPREPAALTCLGAYVEELGRRFDSGFDPAQSISASAEEMTLPLGLFLVATLGAQPVGCGALKLHADSRVGEVKRMWTSPDVRGLGLGRRILERLAEEAQHHGMMTLRLETNRSLVEARQLYEAAGFVEVEAFSDEPYAHHWFQRDLAEGPDV